MRDEKWRSDWRPPVIEEGKPTKWQWMVQGVAGLTLGRYVDIGAFTYINARYGVTIGDDVQVGSHCSIYSESTIDDKRGPVTIGRGALIGTHSTIMPGVTIGENAVIGAYSFVREDVSAGATAFGIPARIIKRK